MSAPDATGAQHALGDFTRLYTNAEPVIVVAPATLGRSHFTGWYQRDKLVEKDQVLHVPANADSYLFKAQWTP